MTALRGKVLVIGSGVAGLVAALDQEDEQIEIARDEWLLGALA